MRITCSVIVEELAPAGNVRSTWRTTKLQLICVDSPTDAQLILERNKAPVRVRLANGVSRVVTPRWKDGMMTIQFSHPRCQLLLSRMIVAELQELAVFLNQFPPSAGPNERAAAAEVARRIIAREGGSDSDSRKRGSGSYGSHDDEENDASAASKRAKGASSIFITRTDTAYSAVARSRAPAPLSEVKTHNQNTPIRITPAPSYLSKGNALATKGSSLSPSANALFAAPPPSAAALAGAAAAAARRAPLAWRGILGAAAAEALSPAQQDVMDLVAAGSNVYFTGSAGTGKSHLLQALGAVLNAPAGAGVAGAAQGVAGFRGSSASAAASAGAGAWGRAGAGGVVSLLGPRGTVVGTVGHGGVRALGGAAPPRKAYFTSTTGVTAVQIGGSTLLHWAGVGASDRAPGMTAEAQLQQAVARVRKTPELETRWRRTDVLVIDEVSMLSADLFTLLEGVARAVRANQAPFGGIQLVVCGDFYQLPPVTKTLHSAASASFSAGFSAPGSTGDGAVSAFPFESPAWAPCFPPAQTVLLSRVYRQQDNAFADALNSIREGRCGPDVVALLQPAVERGRVVTESARRGTFSSDPLQADLEGANATWLLTRKAEVEERNARMLARLPGAAVTLQAVDVGQSELLDRATPVRKSISLKVGARVLLMKNISVAEGLCNGCSGEVLGFTGRDEPIVSFASARKTMVVEQETWPVSLGGAVVASRSQFPLELAWAVSVHKSQGMSLDQAVVSLNAVFEYGQAYVALSRVRSLEGLFLVGFDPSAVRAHPRVAAYYDMLQAAQRERRREQEDNEVLSLMAGPIPVAAV